MLPPRLLATASFRLTLVSAGLFCASAVLVFGTMYWAAARFMAGQLDESILSEVASLQEDVGRGGDARMAQLISQRAEAPANWQYFYLLTDGAGRRLAGNLPAMAALPGWQARPMPAQPGVEMDEDHSLRAFGTRLNDGSLLLVARDVYAIDEVTDLMERTFAVGLAVTLVLAFGSGTVVSARFLRRIETINRISREIMDGDLSRRIPLHGTGDDFDRLSANLNGMLERIQSLMQGLGQVSSDIAHDLRTPLARLRQRLEGVRLSARTVGDYEEAVDRAIAETDAVLETFAALLRITQIESGSRRAGFAEIDLSAVVHTIIETYAPVAEDGGRRLSGTVAPGVTVRGDHQLLTQMLANLVENALNHTPPGTSIAMDLLPAGDGHGPRLVVADDGPGIPVGERDKVFRRFYRLDASRTTPGSGLGLSLVAAIADLHGAVVMLEDNAPGLRVTVSWPRAGHE